MRTSIRLQVLAVCNFLLRKVHTAVTAALGGLVQASRSIGRGITCSCKGGIACSCAREKVHAGVHAKGRSVFMQKGEGGRKCSCNREKMHASLYAREKRAHGRERACRQQSCILVSSQLQGPPYVVAACFAFTCSVSMACSTTGGWHCGQLLAAMCP